MIQEAFAQSAKTILEADENVIGLAVGGSWITQEMDEYSDLDLIVVTQQKITGDNAKMVNYAKRLGNLLSGFTGEHVGEPRLLICLYDDPLLHVDIKFVTLQEFYTRIETPIIILDKLGELERAINNSEAQYPYPDYQWIEDRFWIWIHYALLKIGRGEYLEACDFMGYLRMVVFGPLLHIKNGKPPRGVRKAETELVADDMSKLLLTLSSYNKNSLLNSLKSAINLYKALRVDLYKENVQLQNITEERVIQYFNKIESSHLRT